MSIMPKSLISIRDFSKDEILHILDVAKEFEKNHEQNFLAGKVIACLFFEPSTRTRLSFEAAVNRLGAVSSDFRIPVTPALPRAKPLKIPSGLSPTTWI